MSDAEESTQRRLARNLNELLQEIRVAQAGVQILFGFLLSIAFTQRYTEVGALAQATHLITVLFAAGAVAMLTAPVAWHRVLFRRGRREEIVAVADRFALIGLACLALAMTGTVLLLAMVVIGGAAAAVCGAVAAIGFAVLWFLLPYRRRGRAALLRDEVTEGGSDR